MFDATAKLPASLEAIRTEAAKMLKVIDEQRAQVFVQQLANAHDDDAPYQSRDGVMISYAERVTELDQFEANLRNGLPPVVTDALGRSENERNNGAT